MSCRRNCRPRACGIAPCGLCARIRAARAGEVHERASCTPPGVTLINGAEAAARAARGRRAVVVAVARQRERRLRAGAEIHAGRPGEVDDDRRRAPAGVTLKIVPLLLAAAAVLSCPNDCHPRRGSAPPADSSPGWYPVVPVKLITVLTTPAGRHFEDRAASSPCHRPPRSWPRGRHLPPAGSRRATRMPSCLMSAAVRSALPARAGRSGDHACPSRCDPPPPWWCRRTCHRGAWVSFASVGAAVKFSSVGDEHRRP